MKWNSAISCGLAVCPGVEIKNCISSRHRFNQRRMNPSNFTGKHEYPSILLQTPICIPVDGPRENGTLIGKRLELAHIHRLVRIAAHNNQWPVRLQTSVSAKHEFWIIFRFEPCDVEDVPPAGQSEA